MFNKDSISTFSIVVATDADGGIAKNGVTPWNCVSDMKFFRELTIGKGNNLVIMGRLTYYSLPEEHRPLRGRTNMVISRTQDHFGEAFVYSSLLEALVAAAKTSKQYDDVFVIGGEMLYREAIDNFLYLCKKIYVTKMKLSYDCDKFFPLATVGQLDRFCDPISTRDYIRYTYSPKTVHDEYQYLGLLEDVLVNGESKSDRTDVGTLSLFGATMTFDLTDRIPIFTTKKVNYDAIIKELLFFLSGKTDTKILKDQGVSIWNDNTSRSFLDKRGLVWQEGDMGHSYGHLYRHWGAEYDGCDRDYRGQGIDQIVNVIKNIREDPFSRRHVVSAWDPSTVDQAALPPCHILYQFNVSGDRRWLDCQVYQRSGDLFLGIPFNVASYAILTYMVAHITKISSLVP